MTVIVTRSCGLVNVIRLVVDQGGSLLVNDQKMRWICSSTSAAAATADLETGQRWVGAVTAPALLLGVMFAVCCMCWSSVLTAANVTVALDDLR